VTTVTGQLRNPGSVTPLYGAVNITLVDYSDVPVVGFDVTDKTEILAPVPLAVNADGTWTVDLVPNSTIELAGGEALTAWRVTESGGGANGVFWIVVPATGGPYWVGDLRTTLVNAQFPSPITNLAVSGTLTLHGIALASPPSITTEFLSGDGTWRTPGGGPPSGTAGGDLAGSYPAPTVAKVNGVAITGTPSAGAVPIATSPTAAAWGTLSASRDRRSAALGLLGQPFDYGAINDSGLGLTSGFLILMLCMPDAGTVAALDLLLGGAGSGATGVSNVCAFSEDGSSRLALSADVTTQLSNPSNAGLALRLPFAASFAADGQTAYYFGIFCQMSSNPTIGGVFASLHLPAVNGHKPGIVVGGLSSVPTSIDVAAANAAGASYWLAPSP
jgi:hypothetical protein